MRRIIACCLIAAFIGCTQKSNGPDVSGIPIKLTVQHFEQEFFQQDSTKLGTTLDPLLARYPGFGENFMNNILNADPRWSDDTITNYVKGFLTAYRPVYDSVEQVFRSFKPYENEIRRSLQYCKYYFPAYPLPEKIITYIGPMDGYGDILTEDAIVVGLHHHLGNFSMYRLPWIVETYPEYISRRFEPATISVNALSNIVNDMYPIKDEEKSLVLQMVERGKRLYLLSLLLPDKEPYRLIGYSEKQLKACYAHEAEIWDLFLQNQLLRSADLNLIKNYIGESPKTVELGEDAPGNIGSFAGWQIVKKFMEKHPELKPEQLMQTDDEKVFQEARYKP